MSYRLLVLISLLFNILILGLHPVQAEGLTLYLAGSGADPELSDIEPSGGTVRQVTVWNSTSTKIFDNYFISEDIEGTEYTFNLICASTATRDFSATITIGDTQVASRTFTVSGSSYTLYTFTVDGIDPEITGNEEVVLEVVIDGTGGATSGLMWGDTNPVKASIILPSGGELVLDPPLNLMAEASGDSILLTWEPPNGGGPGLVEELVYDDGSPTGAYSYNGATMATHMSPTSACKILSLKYYTTVDPGDNTFNAEIYEWDENQPGDLVYTTEVNAVEDNWVEVDISENSITIPGDFVAGFGSMNETTFLGYDANDNNGRSWDFVGGNWSMWNEAYFIRAVVQYTDGRIVELTPIPVDHKDTAVNSRISTPVNITDQLMRPVHYKVTNSASKCISEDLLGYKIYRYGSWLNSVTAEDTSYIDNDLDPGTYCYTVTAIYSEGESDSTNQACATIDMVDIDSEFLGLPYSMMLEQNAPNPFRDITTIYYYVPEELCVNISVYNIQGQLIEILVNESMESGHHAVRWDARDVPSGEYIYKLSTDNYALSERCLIIR